MVHQQEVDPKFDNFAVEDDQGLGRGRSLLMPCVQGFVRSDFCCIPERYIRDSVDSLTDDNLWLLSHNIPVTDFSLFSRWHEGKQRKVDIAC